ncbi:hypothetical protein B0H19DRAFT_593824 [Mycena capillaripes]|nr:hypothetical protein B0H19DRAFT_593824 [Mycena capillaripes]
MTVYPRLKIFSTADLILLPVPFALPPSYRDILRLHGQFASLMSTSLKRVLCFENEINFGSSAACGWTPRRSTFVSTSIYLGSVPVQFAQRIIFCWFGNVREFQIPIDVPQSQAFGLTRPSTLLRFPHCYMSAAPSISSTDPRKSGALCLLGCWPFFCSPTFCCYRFCLARNSYSEHPLLLGRPKFRRNRREFFISKLSPGSLHRESESPSFRSNF